MSAPIPYSRVMVAPLQVFRRSRVEPGERKEAHADRDENEVLHGRALTHEACRAPAGCVGASTVVWRPPEIASRTTAGRIATAKRNRGLPERRAVPTPARLCWDARAVLILRRCPPTRHRSAQRWARSCSTSGGPAST